jgi:hypothetical protein
MILRRVYPECVPACRRVHSGGNFRLPLRGINELREVSGERSEWAEDNRGNQNQADSRGNDKRGRVRPALLISDRVEVCLAISVKTPCRRVVPISSFFE